MDSFFQRAFQTLPGAVTHPLAFAAYVTVLVCWLIIAMKVRRTQTLLANIEKLPEKDRLDALRTEMGEVRLRRGLSPSEWIRHRVHRYYFAGFCIACALVAILAVLAITKQRHKSTPELDITASPQSTYADQSDGNGNPPAPCGGSDSADAAATDDFIDGLGRWAGGLVEDVDQSNTKRNLRKLEYISHRIEDRLQITPRMGYLGLIANKGVLPGTSYYWTAFAWDFPEVSVKVANNTTETFLITEAEVRVKSSVLVPEPVLLFVVTP